MATIVMEEYEEFPVLPADSIITVKVDDIAVKEMQGQRGPWQKAEFKFKVLSVPSAEYDGLVGQTVWGSVPFRFTESPDNKLRQWVEAIFGMELSAGFELDTDLLKNRECRAVIGNYDKKAINPRTGNPFKAHQVDALLARGGSAAGGGVTLAPASAPAPTPAAANPWTTPAPAAASGGWSDEPPF
jgi:hypothetical protein